MQCVAPTEQNTTKLTSEQSK